MPQIIEGISIAAFSVLAFLLCHQASWIIYEISLFGFWGVNTLSAVCFSCSFTIGIKMIFEGDASATNKKR